MANVVHTKDVSAELNAVKEGWTTAMGVRFVHATGDEVIVECEIGPQHLQAHGIVHGGVHAGIIETIASIGAALYSRPRGQSVVGLENHTSFIRASRAGLMRATARPVTRGRRTQVWEAHVRDAEERVLATGRVRLLCLDAGTELAGVTLTEKSSGG